jgi:aminoglycoside/choline kinase family phosphotransferase
VIAPSLIAPRAIAADLRGGGFLVLDDLAPRAALDHIICRDGAEAHRERLAAFAQTLGELGAATVGHGEK